MSHRPLIFLATPTVNSHKSNAVSGVRELAMSLNADLAYPWRFSSALVDNKRPVEYARNLLVGRFLASGAEKLFFLDYDVTPAANVLDLLGADGDIVGGIYPILGGSRGEDGAEDAGGYAFPIMRRAEGGYLMEPLGGNGEVVEADAVIMGATVIKRRVFEDERMLLGEVSEPDAPPYFRTPRGTNGRELQNEDTEFCERAKALGYTILCHTGVICGHKKSMDMLRILTMMQHAYSLGKEDRA